MDVVYPRRYIFYRTHAMSRLPISLRSQRGLSLSAPRLLICAVAMALILSIAAGGLFHVHKTPEAAAACTACHIGHAPALVVAVAIIILPERIVIGLASWTVFTSFASADVSSGNTRAPPAIA